jgi:hypothetical protein
VVTVELKCGVHAERESDTRPIFVCHHCGMPVCEEHGWVVLADDAFDDVEEPVSRSAMHCPECAAAFHPRGASKQHGWGIKRPWPRVVASREAPAPARPVPAAGYGPAAPQPQGSGPQQQGQSEPAPPSPGAPGPAQDGTQRP